MSYYMHPASSPLPCRAGHVITEFSSAGEGMLPLSALTKEIQVFLFSRQTLCLLLTFHQLLWCLLDAGVFLDLGSVRVKC